VAHQCTHARTHTPPDSTPTEHYRLPVVLLSLLLLLLFDEFRCAANGRQMQCDWPTQTGNERRGLIIYNMIAPKSTEDNDERAEQKIWRYVYQCLTWHVRMSALDAGCWLLASSVLARDGSAPMRERERERREEWMC